MVVFLDRSLHSLREFTSFTEGPFVTLTVRPFLSRIRSNDFFASLTEGSMSLSARRAVSQRSDLSTQWSLSAAVYSNCRFMRVRSSAR